MQSIHSVITDFSIRFFLLFILIICSTVQSDAQIERPIGINLAGVEDWSEEYVFVDVMNQAREWIAHDIESGAPWSSGVEIPLRPDGYPVEIPYDNGIDPAQGIRTLLFFGDLQNIYPGGNYTLMIDGTGTVQLWGAASGTFNCPVDTTIFVDNSFGGIGLEITESQVSDPIHNIRMVMPGFENTFETAPFHPNLINFLADFQVIRFMDWMKTNGSGLSLWSERNTVGNYTQTLNSGVAYEYIISLCNSLQKDAWINIPHQADNNFITECAQLFRDSLDTGLKIYIEYSNEVWNGIFPQNSYAADQGLLLGYTGEAWERTWKYTAKRSADVFQIFEDEFTNDGRLINVIPGFAGNSWVTNYIIERFNEVLYNPTQVGADAVAIAPYFGGGLANDIGDMGLENSITVPQILDSLENRLPGSYTMMTEHVTVANDHNLDLIAYEGGQHLVAYWPYNQNDAYVDKLLDANRDPRMQGMYCDYFDAWYDTFDGGLFANFSSHGGYSMHGAWGVKETYEDVSAPKYLALQNCVFNSNALPVELLSFDGWKTAAGNFLEWQTASEHNNKGFEVQRLAIGGIWESIGFVDGRVQISTTQNYKYLDQYPKPTENYYRLKQIDLDESFEYSNIVRIENPKADNWINIFPNPSNEWITIELQNSKAQSTKLMLYDNLGRTIWESTKLEEETYWSKRMNIPDSGIYYLMIQQGEQVLHKRIIIN